jgi:hypothetical protein
MPQPWPTPEPQPEPEREPERMPEPVAGREEHEPDAPELAAEAVSAASATPTGRDLHALLESGIAGLTRLQSEEQAAVVRGSDAATARDGGAPDTVPIDELLYRGRAALGRAIELRDEIRREGGAPSSEQLDELFDLLDLAALP